MNMVGNGAQFRFTGRDVKFDPALSSGDVSFDVCLLS